MNADYSDILSRIKEEPIWWDMNAVPRFEQPDEDLKRYMAWIACQDCGKKFWVCFVHEVYFTWGGEHFKFVPDDGETVCPDKFKHWTIKSGTMSHWTKWDANKEPHQEQYWDPMPDKYHYGDPPAHGCAGDTMNSIPECDEDFPKDD